MCYKLVDLACLIVLVLLTYMSIHKHSIFQNCSWKLSISLKRWSKKDPARIWTWFFWWLVRCSYELSQWSSGTEVYRRLSKDAVLFTGWMFVELTKPKKIQPVNLTVSMDKYHLSFSPMPELQLLSQYLTKIQKNQVQILAGSECLFSPSINSVKKTKSTLHMQYTYTTNICTHMQHIWKTHGIFSSCNKWSWAKVSSKKAL